MIKVCQWFAAGQWFSPVSPHNISEILLKVALNTITLTPYCMTVSKHLVSLPFNYFLVGVCVSQVCFFNLNAIWLKVKLLLFLSMMVCTRTGILLLYPNKWETMSRLKIPKGWSETVNQRGDQKQYIKGVIRNSKSKNKKTMIHKILCFNRLYQTYYM